MSISHRRGCRYARLAVAACVVPAPRSLHQRLEDRPLPGELEQEFRVPLDADDEGEGFVLDGLDDAVAVAGGGAEALAEAVDRLAVQGVDPPLGAEQVGQLRAGR